MIPEDPDCEERILMKIVVDAYDESERAAGWHCYLEDSMVFPFRARIRKRGPKYPLQPGKLVTACSLADTDECEDGIWVTIRDSQGDYDIPLEQLEPTDADDETTTAIDDWNYWVERGYSF